jgi:hypothetical protein
MASVVNRLDAQVYWAQVPEWVLYSSMSDRAVRLYGILARRANADNQCFPSRKHLADAMGCSLASVDRALQELVSAGAVAVTHQFREQRQTVNLYTVLAMSSPVTTPLVTSDEGEGRTGDAQNESHRNESHTLATASRERPRDLLFETVAELCGYTLTALTKTARGRLNAAVKELRDINATPDQIRSIVKTYRTTYPDAPVTPQAITGNWAALTPNTTPTSCECGQTLEHHDPEIHDILLGDTHD